MCCSLLICVVCLIVRCWIVFFLLVVRCDVRVVCGSVFVVCGVLSLFCDRCLLFVVCGVSVFVVWFVVAC